MLVAMQMVLALFFFWQTKDMTHHHLHGDQHMRVAEV
jgi:hypothetical protein